METYFKQEYILYLPYNDIVFQCPSLCGEYKRFLLLDESTYEHDIYRQ